MAGRGMGPCVMVCLPEDVCRLGQFLSSEERSGGGCGL